MGKGGGTNRSTGVTYTSSLPKEAGPFYEKLMADAESRYNETVDNPELYTGQRIADPSWQENAARRAWSDMAMNPDKRYENFTRQQLNSASAVSGQIDKIGNNYQPDLTGPGASPGMVSYGGPFDAQKAEFYQNPYQEAVTNTAIDRMTQKYEQDRDKRAAVSAASGGLGGYRDTLMDAVGQSGNQKNIGQIAAEYGSRGWENAQAQYERDRQAMMNAGQFNVQSAMEGWKNRDEAARAAGLMDIQAGQANAQAQLDLMKRMESLGQTATQADVISQQSAYQRLAQLQNAGAATRADQQRDLDLLYSDFIAKRDWPQQQMAQYMGIMSGVPMNPNTTQQTYSAAPDFASMLTGTGLGLYGIANLFGS